MPERTLTRTRLPFTGRSGNTVSITPDGRIHLNGQPLNPVDALELSIDSRKLAAALARAVTEAAEYRITNLNHTTTPQEATHG